MADLTIRNPAVVLSGSRAEEGRSALQVVAAAAQVVQRALRSFVAAMEPAASGERFLRCGFDRETMNAPR